MAPLAPRRKRFLPGWAALGPHARPRRARPRGPRTVLSHPARDGSHLVGAEHRSRCRAGRGRLVIVGITIAQESGARAADVPAYGLGVAGAAVLLARRRRPVAVLGATLVVSLAYHLLDDPAGPTACRCWSPSTAPLRPAACCWRCWRVAFTGVGVAYRGLIEGDPLGVEALSAAGWGLGEGQGGLFQRMSMSGWYCRLPRPLRRPR
jgi:hypothetical protein